MDLGIPPPFGPVLDQVPATLLVLVLAAILEAVLRVVVAVVLPGAHLPEIRQDPEDSPSNALLDSLRMYKSHTRSLVHSILFPNPFFLTNFLFLFAGLPALFLRRRPPGKSLLHNGYPEVLWSSPSMKCDIPFKPMSTLCVVGISDCNFEPFERVDVDGLDCDSFSLACV